MGQVDIKASQKLTDPLVDALLTKTFAPREQGLSKPKYMLFIIYCINAVYFLAFVRLSQKQTKWGSCRMSNCNCTASIYRHYCLCEIVTETDRMGIVSYNGHIHLGLLYMIEQKMSASYAHPRLFKELLLSSWLGYMCCLREAKYSTTCSYNEIK